MFQNVSSLRKLQHSVHFRMRDLSNHEKNEGAKLTKQVEKLNNDLNNLQKDKERLESEISKQQEKMIDLHEQVWQYVSV